MSNNPAPTVVERGANFRKWARVVPLFTNEQGQVKYRTNGSFTEFSPGMHYQSGTNWLESSENIQITQEGGMATNGSHQVSFAANINTSGAIHLITPDAKHLRSHIIGISYLDTSLATNVLFAIPQNSTGVIVGSNLVVYTNAFSNIFADVRETYTKGGFEQDIVLREQPPYPALWGLNPETTWLQVWTEFLDAPEAEIIPAHEGGAEVIGFGIMQIGPGRAFVMGDESNSVPVQKEWVKIQGRTLLLEQVPLSSVAAQLESLPPRSGTNGQGGGQAMLGFPKALPPPPKLAERGVETLKYAYLPVSDRAFVMDYGAVVTASDVTFYADSTYYVSNAVTLSGTTTIEGGAIIKFTNNSSAKIILNGLLVSKTGAYRPAVFTSKNDNSVGETITGSSGSPSNTGATYLSGSAGQTNVYQYLRMSYAGTAITNSGAAKVWHSQFVNSGTVVNAGTNAITLRNVLVSIATNCTYTTGEIKVEQLTADQCINLDGATPSSSKATNTILTGVANQPTWTSFDSSATYLTNTGVFATNGGGKYYLALSSTNRDVGSSAIDPTLLSDLKKKTTYAPASCTNDFTADTTLSARTPLDSFSPDLGYHYDPLDYLVSGLSVGDNTNPATLTFTNGVAIGVSGSYGFNLQLNSSFVSEGTPMTLNRLVSTAAVQEQGLSCTDIFSLTNADPGTEGVIAPVMQFRFTEIATLGGNYSFFNALDGDENPTHPFSSWTMSDSFMRGLSIWSAPLSFSPVVIAWTNNVLEQCSVSLDGTKEADAHLTSQLAVNLQNNLFWQGTLIMVYYDRWLGPFGGSGYSTPPATWQIADNAFDNLSLSYYGVYEDEGYFDYLEASHNGYVNIGALTDSGPVTISSFNYATGPLGKWYQSSSDFHDTGSTTADTLGLYHFTTTTNQVKETNSPVDIGFHYVAVNGNGVPTDSNGDGVSDHLQDKNGNGSFDNGVDVGAWASGSTVTDTNGATGLKVYTPLK